MTHGLMYLSVSVPASRQPAAREGEGGTEAGRFQADLLTERQVGEQGREQTDRRTCG